jgi:hypothetical protein
MNKNLQIMKHNILVNISKGFDEDEKRLSNEDRKMLTDSLNSLVHTAKEQGRLTKLYRTASVKIPKHFKRSDSSLYLYKATSKLNVVLAYDNDRIFNQKIISLYRVVSNDEKVNAFNTTAELLYQK